MPMEDDRLLRAMERAEAPMDTLYYVGDVRAGFATVWSDRVLLAKEIKRLRECQFKPSGDNHHNAALCPHCGAPLRKALDEIEDLRAKMDHMVAMKRKINREVVAELREVRVNPDECYFPPVTLARRVVKAEAEAERLRLRDRDLCDALSFMTVAIDPAQSDDADDWELTDVRWRKRVDEMHAELQRLRDQLDHALDALRASHGGCRMPSVGDECDCGLCKRDRKITDLQAIVAKLPITADGVPIVPGTDLVWIDTGVIGIRRSSSISTNGWAPFGDDYGCCRSRRTIECYSTREAAETANHVRSDDAPNAED